MDKTRIVKSSEFNKNQVAVRQNGGWVGPLLGALAPLAGQLISSFLPKGNGMKRKKGKGVSLAGGRGKGKK